ncbi:S-layer homology domain-containing protein [Paenibacillus sp. H1-7]|uniref:S-layer homology domain-containing protein n=1 Tax=Paenibacillus sp. H1-7 TaxID=2282849 RepID=UPI001EF7F917|nr:S-layer homology domain-containing protein [Paenibacillus sp. H1-7]
MTTKWTSLSIVLALFLSLMAPLTAFAEVTLSVSNLQYRNNPNPPPGNDPANPNPPVDQFTTNPITVVADVSGLNDDEIPNIYFEVTNMNTGKSVVDKTSKPLKTADNQITFSNVTLTEGLNKIVLRYDGLVNTASAPSWAYYIPVSSINNLLINGDPITDGQMFPKKPPYSGATITGEAGNATSIEAYVNGGTTAYHPANFTRGTFTYISNTNRVNDIKFVPGDNDINFVSRNSTNIYNLNKSFIYDDGKAFAYNAFIDQKNATTTPTAPTQKMTPSLRPNLEQSSSNNNNVAFSASLKTNLTGSVTDYVYADIEMVGTGGTYILHYTFGDRKLSLIDSNGNPVSPAGALNNGLTPYLSPAIGVANTNVVKDASGLYEVHNIQVDLPVNTGRRFQQIDVEFTHKNLIDTTKSSFYFSYVDKDAPYVDKVERIVVPGGTNNPLLFETSKNQINEFPATLKVYADKTTKVLVKINGSPYNDGSHSGGVYALTVDTATGKGNVDVLLQGLRDGNTTLEVIPYDNSATPQLVTAGGKSYDLQISAAPYIIVDNIFNGMVVKNVSELTCTAAAGVCISGRTVNLGNGVLKVSINNKDVDAADIKTNAAVPGGFTIALDSTKSEYYFGKDDGRKTVHFELIVNGQKVTEQSYDIFVFSQFLPAIVSFAPDYDPKDVRFSKDTKPDTYYTTSNDMKISGSATNASSLKVTYLKPGSTTPINVSISPNAAGAAATPFRNTSPDDTIKLTEFGAYVFTVEAKNVSGAVVSKSFTITRQPTPYQILEPALIKNEEGKDQANINKNFQKITMLAENADSVIFGKEEAVKETDPTKPGIYYYEARNLKPGKNEIKFTINRSSGKLNGSIILYNVDTPIEGNQYKAELASKMKVFNGDIELGFPKDTKLMRNDRKAEKQYISADRKILFGIASNDDGRVDKEVEDRGGKNFLIEMSGRFKPASKRFWIDGGTIEEIRAPKEDEKLKDALEGSGRLPNESSEFGSSNDTFYNRYLNDLVVPTKRGTLTLKYDANIRDDAWKYVTVFHFNTFADNNGEANKARAEWRNIGGVVDLSKNTITVPFDSFGYYQVMYMDDSFNDVTGHSWARDYLDTLYSKGMMKNKDSSPERFLPDESITRGEFVTMLVKIFNIPLENEDTNIIDESDPNYDGTFKDVQRGDLYGSDGLYDFKHIEAAARAGIVRGGSDGYFGHKDSITRQDAAVMIARAADLKMTTDDKKVLASLQKAFTDGGSIEYYARPAVEAATREGFIEGMPNVLLEGQKKQTLRFAPKDYFSRAEAAAVAIRILKQQKKIPK